MATGHNRSAAVGPVSCLFFCSGSSGLVYQVAWVREFGNVFGNTVYSASLVVAVFMLGLGVGSHVIGRWADGYHARRPDSLLRTYGWAEIGIAALGASVALLLPHLGWMSATVSWYAPDATGWQHVSSVSHVMRAVIAATLLLPVTFIMGGTLTLLIRHLVDRDVTITAPRTALLYAVNTLGAAVGCFATDAVMVPAMGLRATQGVAVALNVAAGIGALALARRASRSVMAASRRRTPPPAGAHAVSSETRWMTSVAPTSVALALTGFAAMGLEMLWLRHLSLQLGQFRAVFSTVLTVVLSGMGLGSLFVSLIQRRIVQPALWLMVAQAGLVVSTLVGVATANAATTHDAGQQLGTSLAAASAWSRALGELWFNARPIIGEVAWPALLMGLAFPLGNALVQRSADAVAGRAGLLYLSNTVGAVAGSLVTGFMLLPLLGIQTTAATLASVALAAIGPLYVVSRADNLASRSMAPRATAVVTAAAGAVAVVSFLQLPSRFVLERAQALPTAPLVLSEGVNEVIAVTDTPPFGRALWTNGHPMAGTAPLGQRYMRALAHIPLLAMHRPERALVIGFGVGNTAHAATLHPSIDRVHIAELSTHVLGHAHHFSDANRNVLTDPRVSVYVNDGRQHLLMQSGAAYDLITLEPPPIAHAGVGALYSREFYELARSRLRPGGYISQWLPVYQVSPDVARAMIRAFVDVFPEAVLLSGAKADLMLLGTTAASITVDPEHLSAALARAPKVQADLRRLDLGRVREIVGTFIGSSRNLIDATRDVTPVTDDRPLQEYTVRSLLEAGRSSAPDVTSASLIDLTQVSAWCPTCFVDGKPVALVGGLDTYLALLDEFYTAPVDRSPQARADHTRAVDGSRYLGAILPDSADVNWHVGRALSAKSAPSAIEHLQRAVDLGPDNAAARFDLATALLEAGRDDEAVRQYRVALPVLPEAAKAYNAVGVALAARGKLTEAIEQFQHAVRLEPAFADARMNLERALARGPGEPSGPKEPGAERRR